MNTIFHFISVGVHNNEQYDCSFTVAIQSNATPQQYTEALDFSMSQFKQYHPTGRIVQQKQFNIN